MIFRSSAPRSRPGRFGWRSGWTRHPPGRWRAGDSAALTWSHGVGWSDSGNCGNPGKILYKTVGKGHPWWFIQWWYAMIVDTIRFKYWIYGLTGGNSISIYLHYTYIYNYIIYYIYILYILYILYIYYIILYIYIIYIYIYIYIKKLWIYLGLQVPKNMNHSGLSPFAPVATAAAVAQARQRPLLGALGCCYETQWPGWRVFIGSLWCLVTSTPHTPHISTSSWPYKLWPSPCFWCFWGGLYFMMAMTTGKYMISGGIEWWYQWENIWLPMDLSMVITPISWDMGPL